MEKKNSITLLKLGAMGDVVVACKALNALRKHAVQVNWHWVIDPSYEPLARELLAPELSSSMFFSPFDSASLYGGIGDKLKSALALRHLVSQTKPTAIALLYRNLAYFVALTGVAHISRREESGKKNEFDVYLATLQRALKSAGVNAVVDHTQANAKEGASSPERIGILVGGGKNQRLNWPEKKWPKVAELVELLSVRDGVTIELFGSEDDQPEAQAILRSVKDDSHIQNYVGKLTLQELPSRLAELDAFVSVDSGLAQIASAVMTRPHQKIIGLFGPTDPLIWGALPSGSAEVALLKKQLPCSPCYKNDGIFPDCKFQGEDFQKCMKEISATEVAALLS